MTHRAIHVRWITNNMAITMVDGLVICDMITLLCYLASSATQPAEAQQELSDLIKG